MKTSSAFLLAKIDLCPDEPQLVNREGSRWMRSEATNQFSLGLSYWQIWPQAWSNCCWPSWDFSHTEVFLSPGLRESDDPSLSNSHVMSLSDIYQ